MKPFSILSMVQPMLPLLILGLISCDWDSSGKKNQKTEDLDKTLVEIQNTDGTFQKIQQSSELRVSGQIVLNTGKDPFTQGDVSASVKCLTNFIQEPLERETLLPPVLSIDVKDIMPSKVFSPTSAKNPRVICDIRLDVNRPKDPLVIIMKETQILGLKAFYNLEMDMGLLASKGRITLRDDLLKVPLKAPMERGMVETLCGNRSSFEVISSPSQTHEAFLPTPLFQESNRLVCRYLFRDQQSSQVWLTKAFQVQKDLPYLSVKRLSDWPGEHDMALSPTRPLVRYQISNVSPQAKAPLLIRALSTSIRHHPYYQASGSPNTFIRGKERSLSGQWVVEDQGLSPRIGYDEKKRKVYLLDPGETIELVLYGEGGGSCPPSIRSLNCRGDLFMGNSYLVDGLPELFLHSHEDYPVLVPREVPASEGSSEKVMLADPHIPLGQRGSPWEKISLHKGKYHTHETSYHFSSDGGYKDFQGPNPESRIIFWGPNPLLNHWCPAYEVSTSHPGNPFSRSEGRVYYWDRYCR